MYVFSGFIVLAGLIGLVLGLIKPRLAVPGATKTRGRAALIYGSVIVLGSAIGSGATPPQAVQPVTEAPSHPPSAAAAEASSEVAATAFDEAQAFESLCSYNALKIEAIRAVEREIGANPHEAIQAGEIIELKQEAVIAPRQAEPQSVDDALRLLAELARIPAGDSIEILDRRFDGNGSLTYLARWVERDAVGIVKPASLGWLSHDADRIFAHGDLHSARLEARLEPARAELFEEAGLDYNQVIMHSARAGWTCPTR
jgi:hypothetical protein